MDTGTPITTPTTATPTTATPTTATPTTATPTTATPTTGHPCAKLGNGCLHLRGCPYLRRGRSHRKGPRRRHAARSRRRGAGGSATTAAATIRSPIARNRRKAKPSVPVRSGDLGRKRSRRPNARGRIRLKPLARSISPSRDHPSRFCPSMQDLSGTPMNTASGTPLRQTEVMTFGRASNR